MKIIQAVFLGLIALTLSKDNEVNAIHIDNNK